jgi:hypothetical protein
MLHEIILSLLGFTGNIIVRNKENTTFEVNNKHQHQCEEKGITKQSVGMSTVQCDTDDCYGDVFDLLTEAEQVSCGMYVLFAVMS